MAAQFDAKMTYTFLRGLPSGMQAHICRLMKKPLSTEAAYISGQHYILPRHFSDRQGLCRSAGQSADRLVLG